MASTESEASMGGAQTAMRCETEIERPRQRGQRRISGVARSWRRLKFRLGQYAAGEVEQNAVRMFNGLVFGAYITGYYLLTGNDVSPTFAAWAGFMLYGLAVFGWIALSPAKSEARRALNLLADHGIVTWALMVHSAWMSPVYVLYISINIGYGARYGRKCLYLSTAIATAGFALVILFNDYWRSLTPLNVGLLLGILMVPYYAGLFYKRLGDMNARLRQLATRDMLTGLPNRRFLFHRLREAVAAAERHNRAFALLFLDIDDFKRINEAQGHDVGDAALRATADVLRDSVRNTDTVARLGGDEFVILLQDARGGDVIQTAINLREAVAAYTANSSASIGIATYPECGVDADSLIRHADRAMQEAKWAGKNRCIVCPDLLGSISTPCDVRDDSGDIKHRSYG